MWGVAIYQTLISYLITNLINLTLLFSNGYSAIQLDFVSFEDLY